ncbi:hypothetical protein [Actinocorallia aurantiaca]|uniref:Nitrate ABC transporter substrate-binding protein n=1 Tax=Actinocorallia aurantiaca TaxID=46204 RepID=A0ABN3TVQ8_9ACTN
MPANSFLRRALGTTALLTSVGLLATACGGDDTTEASSDRSGVLSGVCPATVVFQADWEPESEHGGLYELLGDDYEVDTGAKAVRGPLMAEGVDTGVDVEIRIGGAPVGYQSAQSLLYQDKKIMFGYGRVTEYLVTQKKNPLVAVMAQLEKSPYAVYWDPETYPAAEKIADLKADGARILMGPEVTVWQEYLVGTGVIAKSQVDQSDAPKPATFVAAGGKDAEAGFITAEPFMYEKEIKAWGRPVKGQLIHDTGYPEYFQSLVVRKEDVTAEKDCLAKLVPILQQAQIDYITDYAGTNELIVELVEEYATGWTYTPAGAEFSAKAQLDMGLVSNGDDGTLGNYDLDRVKKLIGLVDEYAADADVSGLTPEDLVTNEFIDASIGLKN